MSGPPVEFKTKTLPYNYVERKTITSSTTDQSFDFTRYPDEIVVYNSDGSNAVYVSFDVASDTTNGYIIPASTERRFTIRCASIHVITSTGTPIVKILAFAYEDDVIQAGT